MQLIRAASRRVALDVPDGRGGRTDCDVRYYVAGEGPPVVLLHGIGLDAASVSWRYLLEELSADHAVYAPDLPGHGDSGKPRVRYTTGFFRAVLDAFLAALDLAGASLVGISMGGSVALSRALAAPVDRLVLVDSYGLGTDAPWRPAASVLLRVPGAHRRWWAAVGASRGSVRSHLDGLVAGTPPPDLVEDVYRAVQDAAVGRTTRDWQRSEFRAGGLATCYLDRLEGLAAETLFVHGAADPLLPASWSRRAAEKAGGELRLLEGVGHWPPREAPGRFGAAVASFLG